MRPLVFLLAAVVAAACATVPDPASPEGRLAAQLARLQTQEAQLGADVEAQKKPVADGFADASRKLDYELPRGTCVVNRALVQGALSPIRFDAGAKKFRLVTEAGACRLVSP